MIIKIALLIAAVAVALIVFIHILPWLLGLLAVVALVKLYHWFNQPRNGPPTNWPWKD